MYDATSPYDTVRAPLTSADDYDCQPAGAAWHYTDRVDPRLRAHAEYVERTRQAEQARREAERPAVLARIAQQQAERCAAARTLAVRQIGPAQYLVSGGKEAHAVDLTADGAAGPRCDCADALYRPHLVCKHTVAAQWASEAAGKQAA